MRPVSVGPLGRGRCSACMRRNVLIASVVLDVEMIDAGVAGVLTVTVSICRACWRRGLDLFAAKDPN